jgi:O-antigen ligase
LTFYIKAGFLFLIFVLLLKGDFLEYNKIGILRRINEGDFSGTNSQTTGHRYNAIVNAIDRIYEKPLWGYQNYSLSMFNKYNNLLSDSEKGDLTYLTTPNNQILAIICDYGFIGLLFFIVFIYSLIKIVRKKGKGIPPKLYAFKQSAFIWLVVFIIFNQSATWFLPGSFLWILICIIMGISYKINRLYGIK